MAASDHSQEPVQDRSAYGQHAPAHRHPDSIGGAEFGFADVPKGPLGLGEAQRAAHVQELRAAITLQAEHASCPTCHTLDPAVTRTAVEAGADWCCRRCGQRWNGRRLAAVAAYAAWDAARKPSPSSAGHIAISGGDVAIQERTI